MPFDVHAILVHFPIALTVTVFMMDWGRWLFDRKGTEAAGFWGGTTPLLLIALVSAGAAVISGLYAREHLILTDALQLILDRHEFLALVTTCGLALLSYWRVSLRGAFPHNKAWLYLVLLLLVAGSVVVGGYSGGMMVFEHGAGVSRDAVGMP